VTWLHVGGHSGHIDQERCDLLAAQAARQAKAGTGHEGRA
jgi:ribonuclease HI